MSNSARVEAATETMLCYQKYPEVKEELVKVILD